MSGSDYNCATVLHGIFSIHADSIHADDDALRGQTNALVVTDRLLTRSRLLVADPLGIPSGLLADRPPTVRNDR
jgi:hypothetical protein